MSAAIRCDQCKKLEAGEGRDWFHLSGPKPFHGADEADLCSRQCVRLYVAGDCPADPDASYNDWGEDACRRCGSVAPWEREPALGG